MRCSLLLTSLFILVLAVPASGQGLTAEEREILGIDLEAASPSPHGNTELNFRLGSEVLLVPESTGDAVMVLDAVTGNVINLSFVVDGTNLSTPINAIADLDGSGILVCDQLTDQVVQYDADGVFESVFAPAGGPDTSILDNARGCATSGGALHVTVASGANADAIASFDATGTYTGNLIANLAGGMDGPFDVLFRAGDILVAAIDVDGIYRYDLAGTFIELFATGQSFLEQLHETGTGNVLAADFTDSGVYEYLSDGTPVGFYSWSGIGGLRGVYELPSGNLLVTNGSGVHEVTRAGAVLRTIVSGVSGRFIENVDASVVPVEFGSFDARLDGPSVALTWNTLSETNNAGFEVQMASGDSEAFETLAFVAGHGTTTEVQSYSYHVNDLAAGTHYFRLRQIDFDGALMVTGSVEVTLGIPGTHQLANAYPNPFNPQSQFTLAVASDQRVTADLFNALGQRVAVVFEGTIEANQVQTITLDGTGLPSGTYVVRVNGERFSDVLRVTLLK